jgi:hypothetical protein
MKVNYVRASVVNKNAINTNPIKASLGFIGPKRNRHRKCVFQNTLF